MDLDDYRYFFFDLDKTIWNWDDLIIGAADLIDSLREADKHVYFHTDNTLLSREGYAKKLNKMGIEAEKEDILTSGFIAGEYLSDQNITEAYVIGEQGLMDEIGDRDIEVNQKADTVVAGLDRKFSYEKAKKAMKIMNQGGEAVLCSSEKYFRTSSETKPHQGPFNKTLEQFGDVQLVGKPSQVFRDSFQDYFDYLPEKSAFIGDRLADIETGNRLGMTTASVMSGQINREKLAKAEDIQTPDFGLSSLNRLKRRII